jgi:hypothetical protein
LLPTSPLINAGTGDFATGTLDFDGNPRLNDVQYDIGAFENQNVLSRTASKFRPESEVTDHELQAFGVPEPCRGAVRAHGPCVTFCVGDATALQNALMTANSNGEDDIVKIKPGTYAGGSGVAFAYSTSQSDAITISGGWVDLSIFDCVLQIGDPTDTVLSGSDVRPVLQMSGSGTSADMTLENLTIRDGNGAEFGGLRMSSGNFFGDLLVDRVYFVDNVSATFNGGASIGTQGTATVRNSWFRNNRCGSSICAVQMVVNHTNSTDTRGTSATTPDRQRLQRRRSGLRQRRPAHRRRRTHRDLQQRVLQQR